MQIFPLFPMLIIKVYKGFVTLFCQAPICISFQYPVSNVNTSIYCRVAMWAKAFGEELLELGEKMTKSVEIKKVNIIMRFNQ